MTSIVIETMREVILSFSLFTFHRLPSSRLLVVSNPDFKIKRLRSVAFDSSS